MNASSESALLTDTRGIILAAHETAARSVGVGHHGDGGQIDFRLL